MACECSYFVCEYPFCICVWWQGYFCTPTQDLTSLDGCSMNHRESNPGPLLWHLQLLPTKIKSPVNTSYRIRSDFVCSGDWAFSSIGNSCNYLNKGSGFDSRWSIWGCRVWGSSSKIACFVPEFFDSMPGFFAISKSSSANKPLTKRLFWRKRHQTRIKCHGCSQHAFTEYHDEFCQQFVLVTLQYL